MSSQTLFLCLVTALLLPLLSTGVCSTIPNRYRWLAPIASTLLLLFAVIFAFIVSFHSWGNDQTWQTSWFSVGSASTTVGIYLTNASLVMLITISLISLLVHIFSIGYMAGDSGEVRYFSMLGFFTFAMLGLVLADNLLLLF